MRRCFRPWTHRSVGPSVALLLLLASPSAAEEWLRLDLTALTLEQSILPAELSRRCPALAGASARCSIEAVVVTFDGRDWAGETEVLLSSSKGEERVRMSARLDNRTCRAVALAARPENDAARMLLSESVARLEALRQDRAAMERFCDAYRPFQSLAPLCLCRP